MRTLIVNANWIGDVLFSTASIRAIRKNAPLDYLACLVPRRCEPLLRGNPHLDEVLVADDRDHLLSLGSSWGVWQVLKKRKFDRVFFFHRSATKKFLAFCAGIPDRVGFVSGRGKDDLLTQVFQPPPPKTHRVDHFLSLLETQGIAPDGRTPDFFPSEKASGELKKLLTAEGLKEGHPYAVIHPGGNWDLKRWPPSHFAFFARLFLNAYPECSLILCGTDPEKRLIETILRETASSRAVSLCGKTSLDVLALLLKGARFILSNDSGPIHLAASQKVPIVGIYGPTAASITGPVSKAPLLILSQDVGCQVPCYFRTCDGHQCMAWQTPEAVFQKVQAWLTEQRL